MNRLSTCAFQSTKSLLRSCSAVPSLFSTNVARFATSVDFPAAKLDYDLSDDKSKTKFLQLEHQVALDLPQTLIVQLRISAYHTIFLERYLDRLRDVLHQNNIATPSVASLPKKTWVITVNRSPHGDKKHRDQFQRITHKRLVEIDFSKAEDSVALSYRLLRIVGELHPEVNVKAVYFSSKGETITK